MMPRAASSISALKTNLSFSAIARGAAGLAEISSTNRFTLGNFANTSSPRTNGARRAPQRHVDDGIGIADHVAAAGEMIVENAVMPLRFELIAVIRIFQVFRREVLEMHRLARIRADAAGDEHQP